MSGLSIVWNVSPEIFSIGGLSIRWYGVLFALAFVVSYFLMKKTFVKDGVEQGYLDKLSIYMFVSVLVGARLGHCLFYEFSYYINNPLEMILPIQIYEGGWRFVGYQGLASHGAAIGIIVGVILFYYKTNIPTFWVFDRLAIAISFAGASIRLGNLMNSEIYGHYTNLPWGFIFVRDGQNMASHPTQLYEALAYIALGLLLYYMAMRRNKTYNQGFLFGIFLVWLFMARFLIEFLKNSQVGWEDAMTLNMGQWLSLPFVIGGVIILIASMGRDIGKTLDKNKLIKLEKKKK